MYIHIKFLYTVESKYKIYTYIKTNIVDLYEFGNVKMHKMYTGNKEKHIKFLKYSVLYNI